LYPVSLGFSEAERRIKRLIANGHHAEALVTAVFTFEKTIRRSLRFMAVARGFTSKQAEVLFEHKGFNDLKNIWPCFDKTHQPLAAVVGNGYWRYVPNAVTMRNRLVHGERVYKLDECRTEAERVLAALRALQGSLKATVGFDGWSRLPIRRNAALPWLAQ
jgi:hypothetical protein